MKCKLSKKILRSLVGSFKHTLKKEVKWLIQNICCGLNVSLIKVFLIGFNFYLPLFQIMEMNTQHKKKKIEPVLKILHQN